MRKLRHQPIMGYNAEAARPIYKRYLAELQPGEVLVGWYGWYVTPPPPFSPEAWLHLTWEEFLREEPRGTSGRKIRIYAMPVEDARTLVSNKETLYPEQEQAT